MSGTDLVPYTNPPRPWRIVIFDEYAIARPAPSLGRTLAEAMRAADNERRAEATLRWNLEMSARKLAAMLNRPDRRVTIDGADYVIDHKTTEGDTQP